MIDLLQIFFRGAVCIITVGNTARSALASGPAIHARTTGWGIYLSSFKHHYVNIVYKLFKTPWGCVNFSFLLIAIFLRDSYEALQKYSKCVTYIISLRKDSRACVCYYVIRLLSNYSITCFQVRPIDGSDVLTPPTPEPTPKPERRRPPQRAVRRIYPKKPKVSVDTSIHDTFQLSPPIRIYIESFPSTK